MTVADQPYDPFRDPGIPSLSHALEQFRQLPDETLSRKSRARSAVAMFSRLAGKDATQISAQANFVLREFMRFKKTPTSLTAKSIANCKTELRYLIKRLGIQSGPSHFAPWTDEWLAVAKDWEDSIRWKLSRFISFLSARSIRPCDVNDKILEEFSVAFLDSGEVDGARQRIRDTIKAWNIVASLSAQPLPTLHSPEIKRPRWTHLRGDFTQAFRDDVGSFLSSRRSVDLEATEGPTRALRAASLKTYEDWIFRAASALVFSGRPIEAITSLACLIQLDAYQALLKFLRQRQGGKPSTALLSLASFLTSIARNWVGLDQAQVASMVAISKKYKLPDHKTKSHSRLEAFEDERMLAKMLHLPRTLLDEAINGKKPAKRRKTAKPPTARKATKRSRDTVRALAQVAIALEIEWHAPFRITNLNALRLDYNIQRITVRREPRWIIRAAAPDVKNHRNLVYELPADSVRLIERGLRLYEQTGGWLFPGTKGSHKAQSVLGRQIKAEVERRLGVPFHVHMMRGLVATMEIVETGRIEGARALLGDSTDQVIRKHYASTAEKRLIRRAQDTIKNVRLRTAPLVPALPRSTKASSDAA